MTTLRRAPALALCLCAAGSSHGATQRDSDLEACASIAMDRSLTVVCCQLLDARWKLEVEAMAAIC